MKPSHTEIISSSKRQRHPKTSFLYIWGFLLPSAASFNYCMGKDCVNILLNFSFFVPQNKKKVTRVWNERRRTVVFGQFLVFYVNENEGQNCCSRCQKLCVTYNKLNGLYFRPPFIIYIRMWTEMHIIFHLSLCSESVRAQLIRQHKHVLHSQHC